MHTPILAPSNRPTIEAPDTSDMPLVCGSCLDTLAPNGSCMNVGACHVADSRASRRARGETAKSRLAPVAFTRTGNVD
jgi:hypothetical protein